MSDSYLTDLFFSSVPDPMSAETLEPYALQLHDFLLRCGQISMDLYMTTDILLSEQYDILHREITGKSIASQLQGVVESDSDLHVIIWAQKDEAVRVISPALLNLARSRHKKEGRRGNIIIKASEADYLDKFPYYLVAASHDRSKWMVRTELPNQYSGSVIDLQMRNLNFCSRIYRRQSWDTAKLGSRMKLIFDEMSR